MNAGSCLSYKLTCKPGVFIVFAMIYMTHGYVSEQEKVVDNMEHNIGTKSSITKSFDSERV